MLLGFNPQFVDKIDAGTKIHTMREDPHGRWKAGNKIHYATGIRTKRYNNWRMGKCVSVQRAAVYHSEIAPPWVVVDGRRLTGKELELFAKNDGFDTVEAFFEWFDKDWFGKLIHWTEKRY